MAEHHLGMPIEQDLLMVLDSWEHAFMLDYGIKRPDYINAFLENLKWSEVSRRFENQRHGEMHEPGSVWPRVIDHIRFQGIDAMQIWRRDDRLFMIIQTADDYPRLVSNPELQQASERWEALMASFQRRMDGALPREKWAAMQCIFDLGEHSGPTTGADVPDGSSD